MFGRAISSRYIPFQSGLTPIAADYGRVGRFCPVVHCSRVARPQAKFHSAPERKMIAAFAGIFGCQLLGEFIVRAFALPLPGPVLGMFLLFVALVLRGGAGGKGAGGKDAGAVPKQIGAAADGLLGHLSLLFVPASV